MTAMGILTGETPTEPDPDPWTAEWFFDWLVGTPLRIAIIVIGALLLRLALHRFIDGLVLRAKGKPRRFFGSRKAARMMEGTSTLFTERRAQRARTLGSLGRSVVTAVVFTVAAIMILQELGFDVAALIASIGIVGVALGFGAQNLVKDFISGVFMLAEDQYGVGDVIDMGEATGTVEGVGLRVTKLRDADGAIWYVRNGEVIRIGNKSQGSSRALVDVQVAVDEDVARVRELLQEVATELAEDPDFRDRITDEPEVWGVESVSPEAVTIRVVVKAKPLEGGPVARALRQRIQERFEDEGVRLPPPRAALLQPPPGP